MNPQPYYCPPPYSPVWSVRATWSLVIGLASAFVCWIPFLGVLALPGGVAGLWLGNAGFRESQRGLRGHGYAVAGMVLSSVGMMVSAAFHTIIFVALATG